MMGISVTMPTVQTALDNILQEARHIDHQMFLMFALTAVGILQLLNLHVL